MGKQSHMFDIILINKTSVAAVNTCDHDVNNTTRHQEDQAVFELWRKLLFECDSVPFKPVTSLHLYAYVAAYTSVYMLSDLLDTCL